ncbi:hypothetical protein BCR32DRAFT_220678 [Anaeromyces robustus]|uniref:Aurora kinase n=1 Tax=Anaeromyces robustus TaxID=1754192 RepID=A0A1Y1X510_9FUNG|nr:hypothetical protein BCR32DRAFT_220678 [Anaeromyces robustus]|eukprot:ORX80907.1 hypothetical protein BCR32DRAFT_220678 [Anaeromyces robustus]
MGNSESTQISNKEIESRQENNKPHPNANFFSKKGTVTSEDTIITDNQDGLVTSQTSLKTLIDEDNNKQTINKPESSSSSLAIPQTPLESALKLKRSNSQSSNSKLSILNLKKSGSMDDLRKLSRSASSSSTLKKLNKKISQSTLFSKLNKKDSQSSSKLSKTALYPNEPNNNNYPIDYDSDYSSSNNEPYYRPPSQNANEYNNRQIFNNNPYTTIPRYSSSNDIENLKNIPNIGEKSVGKSPSLEKLKEFSKEKKLFYLKPFRSKSSDNLQLLNNGKKESIFATLTRTKSKGKKNDKYKKTGKNNTVPLPQNPNPLFTKTNTVPLFAPVPTTPVSPLPFSAANIVSNVNINSNMAVNPFRSPVSPEEEERKELDEKMNELNRIFQIEEERKRRKEQEEREKIYYRKETCDSDDFRAFSSTTPVSAPPTRKEIDFFQDLDIGRGSRNLNLNLNFDYMDERKYSINSMPLTPTTQYLTTITDLLPNPAANKEESIKESNDTSFEFDSDDDFLNDVLAPFSKNQMKLSDDEANDNDKKYSKTPVTPVTVPITNYSPYQHLKKKSSGSAKSITTNLSRPSSITPLDLMKYNNNNNIQMPIPLNSSSSLSTSSTITSNNNSNTLLSRPMTTTPKIENGIPPLITATPPPLITATPPPLISNTPPPVRPSSINLMDEPLSITDGPIFTNNTLNNNYNYNSLINNFNNLNLNINDNFNNNNLNTFNNNNINNINNININNNNTNNNNNNNKSIPYKIITHANSAVEPSTNKQNNDYLKVTHFNSLQSQYQTSNQTLNQTSDQDQSPVPITPTQLSSPSILSEYSKSYTPTQVNNSQPTTQTIIPPSLLRSSSHHHHHRHHHHHSHSHSSHHSHHSRHGSTSESEKKDKEKEKEKEKDVTNNTLINGDKKSKEKVNGGGENGSKEEKKKSKHRFSLASFRVIRKIGQGRYSKVYMANLKSRDINLALKVIPKNKEIAKIIHQIREEIKIQSHLNHKNVLRLYDYFRDERKIYYVLEYAPKGSVLEFQKRFSNFTESLTSKIIKQTADGLEYIHSKHIVHRDLKPENLLVNENNVIKISDFGCAVFTSNIVPGTLYGTLDYFSPEMIESKMYDERIDIWSLGVIMFELLVGKTPFDDPSVNNIYSKIKAVDYSIPSTVSMSANDLISNILIYDPDKRYSLQDIHSHPWIFKYND